MSIANFLKGLGMDRKLHSEIPLDRIHFAIFQQIKGKAKTVRKLLPLLEDSEWNVRNAAASSILFLISKYPESKKEVLSHLHDLVERSSLSIKLTILEVLGKLKHYDSKPYLIKMLEESGYDLQYAAIRAIGYLDDVDVLYPLKNVVYARDYITKRAAILSVIRITNSVKEEEIIKKLTPHIHLIIESYLELTKLDETVVKILDYGDPESFPDMKGYTESEIVKLESLIETKDYSVEMYQNFAKLIYPTYFPVAENVSKN
ncbi:MAG: HEAT repeat domain-containing protein [Candidatus Heimdallarchaeota archaeon]|nr:HEAT repeat domain-containing protein [Candidatus Heimdallarchaeota archaeon]MCK4254651.1 HEAT repeat domain-containing protein [Candidatus Heimdallarchaeota archaeon]